MELAKDDVDSRQCNVFSFMFHSCMHELCSKKIIGRPTLNVNFLFLFLFILAACRFLSRVTSASIGGLLLRFFLGSDESARDRGSFCDGCDVSIGSRMVLNLLGEVVFN